MRNSQLVLDSKDTAQHKNKQKQTREKLYIISLSLLTAVSVCGLAIFHAVQQINALSTLLS